MRIDAYRPNKMAYDPMTKAIVNCFETNLGGVHYDLFDHQGSVLVVRTAPDGRVFINKYSAHGCSTVTGPAAEHLSAALAKQFPVPTPPAPANDTKKAPAKGARSDEPEPPRAA